MDSKTRVCWACGIEKPIIQMSKNKNYPDGYTSCCLECKRKAGKVYYQENKAQCNATVLEIRHRKRKEATEFVARYKDQPCKDCNGRFPDYVMDFDHIEPEQKRASVSDMVNQGRSIELIEKEIAKCELVCSNCHRVRTHTKGHFNNKH